ncbi:MAG TPA: protein phosphatase 2C domain-containing protein, partial [Bryobacteraceae bacterium]|nr:protein phosphatase 2C domain-containing protein [Bryobacteraceae bacterium]
MAVIAGLRSAGASDPGRKREKNEDRYHADPDRGIFFVVDGVGGQAAGEKAADTACSILKARLERQTGSPADRIREAVALANNEIWRLARENNEWHGMACVLTVAVLEGETVHIGQVGDSRLYLLTPGEIRKLTHDHSPVGEREDRGEIDEVTAMRHPRRNEVYRDVGTTEHSPDDPDFVEVTSAQYPVNGALLLCSDGLSDLVTSAEIRQIVVENAGDPAAAARALIRAANDAGGKDNITVVVAEGPNFASEVRRQAVAPRRMLPPAPPASRHPALSAPAFLLYGLALALGL